MTPDEAIEQLDPEATFRYLHAAKILSDDTNPLKALFVNSDTLNELADNPAHEAFKTKREAVAAEAKRLGKFAYRQQGEYTWLCSQLLNRTDTLSKDEIIKELSDEAGVNHTWHSTAPALWLAILMIGRHLKVDTDIHHLLTNKEYRVKQPSELMDSSDTADYNYFIFYILADYMLGAREFMGIEDSGANNPERLNTVISFSQTPAGRMLACSILEAKEIDNLKAFTESLNDNNFVRSLFNISDRFYEASKNKDNLLIDLLAVGPNDGYYKLATDALSPMTSDIQSSISRRKESLRRRPPKRKITKKIITLMWLPKVLWNKRIDGILHALPELSSGTEEEHYDRDYKKIAKAIQELGLSRSIQK